MYRRLFLAAIGLSPFAAMAAEPLRAVASFSILGDIVRQVGGDRVAVTTIVPPNGDAHDYQPRPADARAIAAAGFVTMNGFDLDNWLARLALSTRTHATLTVASHMVTPRTLEGSTVVDPHAWQDPRNGALYAIAIGDGLASADPPGDAAYRAAAEHYAKEIICLDVSIEAQFTAIPATARRIITTHDAFGYYGARYGIEFLAAQGLSTDAEPSARGIAALVAQIKREKIRVVFLENMTDPRLAQMLARETGAVVGGTVYSDALSTQDGPAATYLDMLRHNTGLFVAAMRG